MQGGAALSAPPFVLGMSEKAQNFELFPIYPKAEKGTVEKMSKRAKPMLSIGMIVKNEENKIEKCLKALQPLRDAISCELVIADTGSTDSTRAIAEQYADLVFDFPWVNDFSAARNAVMDKCIGSWYLTVDADEYLDADVSELVSFFHSPEVEQAEVGYVVQRNYNTVDMIPGDCNDFLALRMARMSTGLRYTGTIHESFAGGAGRKAHFFHATVLHHDGYAWRTQENAREKLQRNLTLLEKELEKHPNNARILMECIESSNFETEKRRKYSQMAMDLLQNSPIEEAIFAPVLARSACMAAAGERYPEAAAWIAFAQQRFPDSAFIRVDVSFAAALQAHHDRDSAKVIQAGEQYKVEWRAFSQNPALQAKTLYLSPLQWVKTVDQQIIDLLLSEAYARTGQPEKAWELLRGWEFSPATPEVLSDWVRVMTLLEHIPGAEEEVLRIFEATDSADAENESKLRHTYVNALLNLLWNGRDGVGVFRRLPGLLGTCAAFLAETDPRVRTELLESVTDWSEYPVPLAQDAIRVRISLPDSFYRQSAEKLRDAITLLTRQDNDFVNHAIWLTREARSKAFPKVWFAFEAVAMALQMLEIEDITLSKTLIACFRQLADNYLPQWYHPDLLCNEANLHLLPNLHRFTWYFLRSQGRLDKGDAAGCVRDLRLALEQDPQMKNMVAFLLDCVENGDYPAAIAEASPELLELAEKVKAILSAYAPDDPMVQAIKESDAYRKVAFLIEDSTLEWVL